jgi:hypothetical protein
MKIIIDGTPANGYQYYGPFAGAEAARKYCKENTNHRMLVTLQPVSGIPQSLIEAERLRIALGDVVEILSTYPINTDLARDTAKKARHPEKLPPVIVIVGNPISGFEYFGPFNGASAAEKWGNEKCPKGSHWLAPLISPSEQA